MKFPGNAVWGRISCTLSFTCPEKVRTVKGKCTGNSAVQGCMSGHIMCLQEMCMQVVYPGNLDIRPVLLRKYQGYLSYIQ